MQPVSWHPLCLSKLLTIEVCGSDEGYVDTKIAVVRGAVETEVNAERDGGPRRIFGAAIEAHLVNLN